GIFRSVTLLHRPDGAASDFFVHTAYDHRTGEGTLRVEAGAGGRVTVPELGVEVRAGESVTLPVEPWTAETPRLYAGELATPRGADVGVRHEACVGDRLVARQRVRHGRGSDGDGPVDPRP